MSYSQSHANPQSPRYGTGSAAHRVTEAASRLVALPSLSCASREAMADAENWAMCSSGHIAQFYESDEFLLDRLESFIVPALRSGSAGIVIASEAHRQGLEKRLRQAGIDLDAARAKDAYLALDARAALAMIMAGPMPDVRRFATVVDNLINRAGANGRSVYTFGEMVALLVADNNIPGAIEVERLWNDLQQRTPFTLLCAYPSDLFALETAGPALDAVCSSHSHVIPAESYSALPTTVDRLRSVVRLQQRANQLEFELARRAEVEERLRDSLAAEEAALQQAKVAQGLRDEFLAIASHELRNPLTGLTLNAQLALRRLERNETLEPEGMARALEAITTQAATISRLLDQLMDVSRLEVGRLSLQRLATDLVPLVAQVVGNARVRTGRHEIHLELPPALHAWVDALRVEQVLVNLLDNAIKFSPDGGGIEVRLRRPEPLLAELSVRDRGLGIPPHARSGMFGRFFQAHDDSANQGLGLGLYVCRQIVELHGGEIRAEFPPDGGTRIVSRFPTSTAEPPFPATS